MGIKKKTINPAGKVGEALVGFKWTHLARISHSPKEMLGQILGHDWPILQVEKYKQYLSVCWQTRMCFEGNPSDSKNKIKLRTSCD